MLDAVLKGNTAEIYLTGLDIDGQVDDMNGVAVELSRELINQCLDHRQTG